MKVLELFAGERCIGKAFEKKGHEVYSIDWDKVHPDIDWYADVSKITAQDILDRFGQPDVVWESPDCFPAGTLIWTDQGYKKVEDIQCFDRVLTHKNRYKSVYATQKTNKHKIYEIKVSGCEPVIVSSEHPYYVRKKHGYTTSKGGHSCRVSELLPAEWKPVKDLDTTYRVGIPINQESKLPQYDGTVYYKTNGYGKTHSYIVNTIGELLNNGNFWWLVGRYFGDGSVSVEKGIVDITCSNDEIDEIKPILSQLYEKFGFRTQGSVSHFTIHSKEWAVFLSRYGVGALNKRITPELLDLPVDLLRKFLDGYISADGHWDVSLKNPVCAMTTISRELAYSLQLAILKGYNRYCSMVVNNNPNAVICGRKVNVHTSYTLGFYRDATNRLQYTIEDGYAWVNIRSVRKLPAKQTTVYNFSVEDDESYTANNIIVHNCTTYSVAAISHHRRNVNGYLEPVTDYAKFCDQLNVHCNELIAELNPKLWFRENPRGAMRKMPFVAGQPRYTVCYCQYGDTRQKPTDIWTNHPDPKFLPPCKPGSPCHEAAPRGSRTGTQGRDGHIKRSLIPDKLCDHIVRICEEYMQSLEKKDERL
jgi:hypothetical protein